MSLEPQALARHLRTIACVVLLPLLLLQSLPAATHGQFTYYSDYSQITITGYNGPGGAVIIPSTIDGLSVPQLATKRSIPTAV